MPARPGPASCRPGRPAAEPEICAGTGIVFNARDLAGDAHCELDQLGDDRRNEEASGPPWPVLRASCPRGTLTRSDAAGRSRDGPRESPRPPGPVPADAAAGPPAVRGDVARSDRPTDGASGATAASRAHAAAAGLPSGMAAGPAIGPEAEERLMITQAPKASADDERPVRQRGQERAGQV